MLRLLILACALSAINAYYISADQCGIPAIEPQEMSTNIVGGIPAVQNSWPWMVEVLKDGEHHCGASLISSQWIVSAAHCFERNPDLSQYQFSVGGHEEADLTETNRQTFQPSTIVSHEEYSSLTMSHDIALIKIAEGVVLNDYVSLVCLATDHPEPGTIGYVTGWGEQETIIQDATLQQVNVPIVAHTTCEAAYPGEIDGTMICAGYADGGKDSCTGDDGGPLVTKDTNGLWTLTGIVSWGYGCADPGKYGVYTDLDHLVEWIQTTIANN